MDTLRVLLFREGDAWVSQCLEYDLNGQGSNLREALNSLARVLAAKAVLDQQHGREPLSDTPAAPPEYFEQFEKAWALCEQPELPIAEKARIVQRSELRICA